ncbi:MAG: hypothetical protein ACFFCI_11505 [Promethearchaeota archaeon]
MPVLEGWEISSDRVDMFQKIMSKDDVGEPVITSKCKLNNDIGFMVVSENGFAWRIKVGYRTSYMSMGKSKWVRWHDVAEIIQKKPGVLLVSVKLRKDGALVLKKGIAKVKRWKLTLNKNKDETGEHFKQRQADLFGIITQVFEQNRGEGDPPTSDSRI